MDSTSPVVVRLDASRRDRRTFDDLVAEARAALDDVAAGDLAAVHTASLATVRAVRLLMANAWDAA